MPQPLHALGCFTADVATYILQPVDWLARSASVPCIGLTLDLIVLFIQLLRGSSLSPGVRESSSKAQRWDPGTSASPSRYRHIYYVLVGLTTVTRCVPSNPDAHPLGRGLFLIQLPFLILRGRGAHNNGNITSLSMMKPQLFPHKDG